MQTKYKHIRFERDEAEQKELKRKTQIWLIWNEREQFLGRVEWKCGWRQYVSTTCDVSLSASCHDDISHFIKQLMDERKSK